MMRAESPPVCVIIAAWNAEATIAHAIESALIQPEVTEVVIVDDGSTDGTVAVARAADDGSRRVTIVALGSNRGPAGARNAGLAASTAPYVALLDADDFFLPDRFAPLFAVPDWDAIADNIAFIASDDLGDFHRSMIAHFDNEPSALTLAAFVDANISRPNKGRRELGFLKPLMRRGFLEEAGLRYDETMRLGEDYALYATMMMRGARFLTIRRCGYVAVERASSLSGNHRTADLLALLAFDRTLETSAALAPHARRAIDRHRRQVATKAYHRIFLDAKRAGGLARAIGSIVPSALPGVVRAVLRDKLGRRSLRAPGVDYLF